MQSLRSILSKQLLLLGVLMAMVSSELTHAAEVEALGRESIASESGPDAYLLDLARTGDRLIVVGERGLLLLSDDEGGTWRQVTVPVSVTLTSVAFADDNHGFVVGHGGSVLTTADRGESWSLSLDGRRIAETILSAAQASGDEELVPYAERLVEEGPDKPLLDLLVTSEGHVLVVGAYGLALKTEDGGLTWTSILERIDNPIGLHIYTIRQSENRILMAGEQGTVWLSQDNGQSFEVLFTPYEGSFFTAELTGVDEIVLAGLRGNVWRSTDNGENWNQILSPNPATINASLKLSNDKLLMVNQAGMVLSLDGDKLVPISRTPLPPLNSILEMSDGVYMLASQRGLLSTSVGNTQ